MVEIFQATTAAIFVSSFIASAFLHDLWASTAVILLTLLMGFYVSDFSFAPPDVNLYYHVWAPGLALVSSLAGYYFAVLFKMDRLIHTQPGEDKMHKVRVGTLAVTLHILFVIMTAFGINAWLGRTMLFGGGVYPFGEDLVHAGIGVTIGGAIGLVVTTILLATAQDAGYRITAKYAWLVLLVPVTFVLTMFDPYRWYWQIIFFVAFAAMWALLYAQRTRQRR